MSFFSASSLFRYASALFSISPLSFSPSECDIGPSNTDALIRARRLPERDANVALLRFWPVLSESGETSGILETGSAVDVVGMNSVR